MDFYILTAINLTIEALACLVLTALLVFLFVNGDAKTKQGKPFLLMVVLLIASCAFDAVIQILDTIPGYHILCIVAIQLTFMALGLSLIAYSVYIHRCISAKSPHNIDIPKYSIYIATAAFIPYEIIVIASLWNKTIFFVDANNVFSYGPYYTMILIYPFMFYMVVLLTIIYYRKVLGTKDALVLSSYSVLPIVSLFLHAISPEIMWALVAYTLALVMIYVGYQAQQRDILVRRMADKRAAVMLSQIQPHFLYNVLIAIENLITEDPSEAQLAVHRFSKYLRGNLDSLNNNELIPFEEELSHIEHYVSLEKTRFREKLKFDSDIKATKFSLPPLTVQPMVENAVRYGVCKKKGGGTVTLKTGEADTHWRITITDDGIGFDPDEILDDGRSHTGIENARMRLSIVCGGTLDIESKPGEGTTVTICIPKGGAAL